MREIKFRGRDGDDWYYGSLFVNECGHTAISAPKSFWMKPVNADTVGQFTGLLDCEGREIYEGDILEVDYPFYWPAPPLPRKRVVVCYLNGKFQFHLASPHSYTDLCFARLAKVIGNVYDNPQLLEEEHDRRD